MIAMLEKATQCVAFSKINLFDSYLYFIRFCCFGLSCISADAIKTIFTKSYNFW